METKLRDILMTHAAYRRRSCRVGGTDDGPTGRDGKDFRYVFCSAFEELKIELTEAEVYLS
jgi:hypothetical protein